MFHNNAITLYCDFLSVNAVSGGEFGRSPSQVSRPLFVSQKTRCIIYEYISENKFRLHPSNGFSARNRAQTLHVLHKYALYRVLVADITIKYELSIYGSTALCWILAAFQFLELSHRRHDSFGGDKPVSRPLPAHRTAQTQNKHI
jgi:hypothetical protein